jgi:hypothetical protein
MADNFTLHNHSEQPHPNSSNGEPESSREAERTDKGKIDTQFRRLSTRLGWRRNNVLGYSEESGPLLQRLPKRAAHWKGFAIFLPEIYP